MTKGRENKRMRNLIRKLIVWYVLKYENACFDVKRTGGAEQTCRVFSKHANEKIVKRAFEYKGIFFSQNQVNAMIENYMEHLDRYKSDYKSDTIPIGIVKVMLRYGCDWEKMKESEHENQHAGARRRIFRESPRPRFRSATPL